MTNPSPLKFDLMSSVLDGEANVDDCRSYQECLDSDQEAQSKHQFYSRFKEAIRESGQTGHTPADVRERLMRSLSEIRPSEIAPAAELARVVPLTARPKSWAVRQAAPWMAAAAAITVVLGTSLIHNVNTNGSSNSNSMALALAQDHSNYVGQPGTNRASQVNPTQVALHQFGQAPEMAAFPDLRPYDARVCLCPVEPGGSTNRPVLHVIYQAPSHEMVSMYGVPEDQSAELPLNETTDRIQPAMEEADHEALATWKRRGWVFSLVSNMPERELEHLAQHGYYGNITSGAGSWSAAPVNNNFRAVDSNLAQPAVLYQSP